MLKKKIIAFLLVLAVTLVTFVACDTSSTPHKHSFSEWTIVSESSCTENGLEKRSCSSCEEEETRILPAHHDYEQVWNWVGHEQASVDLSCKNCDFTSTEQIATITETITPATCSTLGTTLYTASATVDNQTYTDEKTVYLEMPDHNFSDNVCTVCSMPMSSWNLSYTLIAETQTYSVKANSYFNATGVVIPSSYMGKAVTKIESSAFYNKREIVNIYIPDTITEIGNEAFNNCTNVTSVRFSKALKSIGANAFNSTSLTEVVLPEGLETINSYAFYNCTTLSSITLPSSLKTIDACAFTYTAISEISIPASVETIGIEAFSGCAKLTSLTLPDNIKSVGENITSNCANMVYNEYEGGQYLGSNKEKYMILVKAPNDKTTVTIHPDTKIIGKAFNSNTAIQKIELPSNVEAIQGNAFYRCTNLSEVILNDKLTYIGYSSFSSCSSLTQISFPQSLQIIDNSAFSGSGLTSLSLPSSITTIDQGAFSGTKITSLTLPDNIETIEENAFAYCTKLKEITINKNIKKISKGAFTNCSELESISLPFIGSERNSVNESAVLGIIFGYSTSSTSTGTTNQFSSNNTAYNSYYYYIPASLKTVTLTAETTIPDYAFKKCANITTVNLNDGITYIGKYAFQQCGITSIKLPDSVTRIGDYAFYSCNNLTTLDTGKNANIIGKYVFDGSAIQSLTLSNSLSSIDQTSITASSTLNYNTYENGLYLGSNENPYLVLVGTVSKDITELEVHANTRFINTKAVSDCASLTKATIHGGIIKMCNNAFFNCPSLTITINTPKHRTSWADNWNPNNCPILYNEDKLVYEDYEYIVCGDSVVLTAYKGNDTQVTIPSYIDNKPVTDFMDIFRDNKTITKVTLPETILSVPYRAFENCLALTEVVLPSSLENIDDYAFASCIALTNIVIPDSVTRIGKSAFTSCSNLTSVTFGKNVGIIDDGAFYQCSLTSLNLPSTVTYIGASAFYENKKSFGDVVLPNALEYIGKEAFYYSSFNSLTLGGELKKIEVNAFKYATIKFASSTVYSYWNSSSSWKYFFSDSSSIIENLNRSNVYYDRIS